MDLCNNVQRGLCKDAEVSVAGLSWQIPQDEKREEVRRVTGLSWNIPRKKGKKSGMYKSSWDVELGEWGEVSVGFPSAVLVEVDCGV